MTAALRVLLVDDHAVVREGYRRLLERAADIVVAGEAASAAEAYQAFCKLAPAVVVMDLSLPDASGIEATRRLLARDATARVLAFSIHDEPIYAERAFLAGAAGYVTKASAPEVLVEAVRAVARGESFLSDDIAQTLAMGRLRGREPDLACLSAREFEIVRLLALGHTVRAIADQLCVSTKTVSNHQSAIRRKLGAATPAQLVRIAVRSGVVPAD
jgi:DNA-binding NarL/FixJ family response regulator